MVSASNKTPSDSGLVVLTPLIQSAEHNVVRISRMSDLEKVHVLHIAGGEHTGIIINKLSDEEPSAKCDVALSFSVWVSDGVNRKQENRQLRFRFFDDVELIQKHTLAQQFFKDLVNSFLKDYVTFLKRILKLMQCGYLPLREIEVDMQFAKDDEAIQMPDIKEYDSGSEVESVTAAHVQDVLEHAYPNGLSVELIAEALRCTVEEVEEFLHELEVLGVVQKLQNEWIRVDAIKVDESKFASGALTRDRHSPTVAIITCLFVEKQCIDAIIDDSTTVHRYRSGGDSNVYTLGCIGKHRVVATKLAAIGDTREATTSAGSITTRLLGNFQNVEHVFIVGVGGGVAHYTDAARHIRLGDVVVSASDPDAYVFAHSYTLDRETDNINGFVVRRWNPSDNVIAKIAKQMKDDMICEWNNLTKMTVSHLNESNADVDFSRPPPEKDLLTLPVGGGNVVVIPHPNQERTDSVVHVGPVGGMVSYKKPISNEEGEDPRDAASQLRDRFAAEFGLRAVDAGFDSVIAPIRSSMSVQSVVWSLIRSRYRTKRFLSTFISFIGEDQRDAASQLRDRFAAEFGLRAVDAGFDSVIAAVNGSRIDSWTLIRGIADYQHGQSRGARTWQAYAAVRAAALTKALILRLPVDSSTGVTRRDQPNIVMSINLTSNFFRLLLHFRRQDLVNFGDEHERLYAEAKRTSDHSAVTSHYYSVMSAVIDDYFNGSFHFVPPHHDRQTLEEALVALHRNVAKCLKLEKGRKCVDIGCGIGTVMKDLASTEADLTGVTIAANEAFSGNAQFVENGIENCRIIEGDCHHMPFEESTFDSAYAIYALKYFLDLSPVMNEISRVLKPGGLLLVYDLIKTRKYDPNSLEHRKIIEGIEYACGMPSLHTR
uniref:SAM-dependent methyltransferase Erg6/SMT-type domain-containing protein n=1 Tax=Ascaris lumbricoides TaxID=6252 RepID=A0A9J2Q2Q3_ASCLU